MMEKKPIRDQNLHKYLLYNPSVQTLMIEQKEMVTDELNITSNNAVKIHHEPTIIPKITPHTAEIVQHHEIELIM